jgi:hypothetical protein
MSETELNIFTDMVVELEDRLEERLGDFSLGNAYGRYSIALDIAKWATLRIQERLDNQAKHHELALAAREVMP